MNFRLLMLITTQVAAKDLWPDAVENLAVQNFKENVILLLKFSKDDEDKNGLYPTEDSGTTALLKNLAKNWTVIVADRNYVRTEMSLHRRMVLSTARQVVALISEESTKDIENVREMVRHWKDHAAWYDGSNMIIVVETDKGVSFARELFLTLWRLARIINVALLESQGGVVEIFTWVPYNPKCMIEVQNIGKFSPGKPYQLFASQIFKNVNKCRIRATAHPYVPYVFPPNSTGHIYEGLDVRIFYQLANVINFTPVLMTVPEGVDISHALTVNGTPAGPFGLLARAETDMLLWGTRLTYERLHYADAILPPYYSDDLIWVGPMPRRSPRWKAVFLVFSRPIWFTILIFFWISLYTVHKIVGKKNGVSFSYLFMFMWATQLNTTQPIPKDLTRTLFRIFHAIVLFYILTVNALYGSGLYGVLSHGVRLEEINTPDRAIQVGMTVVIPPMFRDVVARFKPEFYKVATKLQRVSWQDDVTKCISRAVLNKDCFLFSNTFMAQHEINLRYHKNSREYLRIFAERITPSDPVFFMAKNHPLLATFTNTLQRLTENGWIGLQSRIILESTKLRQQPADVVLHVSYEEDRLELEMDQLLGAFVAFFLLISASIIAFSAELLVYKFKKKNSARQVERFAIRVYRLVEAPM